MPVISIEQAVWVEPKCWSQQAEKFEKNNDPDSESSKSSFAIILCLIVKN